MRSAEYSAVVKCITPEPDYRVQIFVLLLTSSAILDKLFTSVCFSFLSHKLEKIIGTSWGCYEDQLNTYMNAVDINYWHIITIA